MPDTLRHPEAPADQPAVVSVPVLLSVAHTAELLGCSPDTVRRRISDGLLPAVREHGRVVVRGDDLRRYIDALDRVDTAPARRRTRVAGTGRTYDWAGK